jgi:hypothetical protein
VHCRDHVVQLRRAHKQFAERGVDLVFIGQATPRHAKHFRRTMELDPVPVLADEHRETYKLAGLKRGNVAQLVGPRSVLSGIKHGARSGVMQGRPIGDVAQLGGAAIVAPGGKVVHEQVAQNAGDTIEPDDLLAATE